MHKCTRCQEPREDVSIHQTRIRKDGTIYKRYMCRPCRRDRYHAQKFNRQPKLPKSLTEAIEQGIRSNSNLMRKYS